MQSISVSKDQRHIYTGSKDGTLKVRQSICFPLLGLALTICLLAVHPKFTMLPARLATRGYVSHQVGKWHLGLAKQAFTPVGRGFNTSLGVRPSTAVCSLRVAQLEHSVLSISAASVRSISGERRSTTTTRPAAVSTCGHPIAPPSVTTACTLRSCTPLTRRS